MTEILIYVIMLSATELSSQFSIKLYMNKYTPASRLTLNLGVIIASIVGR